MKMTADKMRSKSEMDIDKHVKEIIELIDIGLEKYNFNKEDCKFIKVNISTDDMSDSEEIIKRVVSDVSDSGFNIVHTPYSYEEYDRGIDYSIINENFKISW